MHWYSQLGLKYTKKHKKSLKTNWAHSKNKHAKHTNYTKLNLNQQSLVLR